MKLSSSGIDRRGRRAGFTLIEALAALALASAGFAVIAQIAGTALHNWHRGRDGAAALDMITTGLAQIGRDLRQSLSIPTRRSPGAPVLFRGDGQSLMFASATGLRPGDLGLEIVSIRSIPRGEGIALVRERGPLAVDLDAPLGDPVVLMQGRLTVRFVYRDEAGQRFESWVDRPMLPASVEMQILRPDGAAALGSPQILVLPARFSADCFDPDLDKTGGRERCGLSSATDQGKSAKGGESR